MDAILLVGGLGTRLRSVVSDVPKCMAPVCDSPFLSYLLSYLGRFPEITRVILSVGYLRETIVEWVATQHSFPFEILYSEEEEPIGTGGAIRKALSLAHSQDVFVLNGDTFFEIDLSSFYSFHQKYTSSLSVALKPMLDFSRYGNVEVDSQRLITAFREKQYCKKGQINGGIYLIQKDAMSLQDLPERFSFEIEVLQKSVLSKAVYGCIYDCYFIDIGIPEDYERAQFELKYFY